MLSKKDGLKVATRHKEGINPTTRPSDRRMGRKESHYFGQSVGAQTLWENQILVKEGRHTGVS